MKREEIRVIWLAVILSVLALLTPTQEAWNFRAPYTPGEIYITQFESTISVFGSEMVLGDKYEFACQKRSGSKISGTVSSRENSFDSEEWGDGPLYRAEFDHRGKVTVFDGGEGDAELGAAMLRFFVYPDREMRVGESWNWGDSKSGDQYTSKFTGVERGAEGPVARVVCTLNPSAGSSRRAVGLFWVRPDGIVERLDWTLENFRHAWFEGEPVKKWIVQGWFVKKLTKAPGG